MWLTVVMKFFGTKTGKMVMVAIVVMALIGGYKWKISGLENKIESLTALNATEQIRNKLCQADIQALQVSVDHQNEKVAELEKVNLEMTIASAESAREAFTDPAEIERLVKAGNGPVAMNNFMKELFQGE